MYLFYRTPKIQQQFNRKRFINWGS